MYLGTFLLLFFIESFDLEFVCCLRRGDFLWFDNLGVIILFIICFLMIRLEVEEFLLIFVSIFISLCELFEFSLLSYILFLLLFKLLNLLRVLLEFFFRILLEFFIKFFLFLFLLRGLLCSDNIKFLLFWLSLCLFSRFFFNLLKVFLKSSWILITICLFWFSGEI